MSVLDQAVPRPARQYETEGECCDSEKEGRKVSESRHSAAGLRDDDARRESDKPAPTNAHELSQGTNPQGEHGATRRRRLTCFRLMDLEALIYR
jgi:hypothetical protein